MTHNTPGTATAWAVRQRTHGDATAKLLLIALAWTLDNTGECTPTMRELAAALEVTPRTVRRAMLALEGLGLVESAPTRHADGGHGPNRYTLIGLPR